MEDEWVEEVADAEDTEEEDVEDVDKPPHNKLTRTSLLYLEPYRLHLDMRKANPHNSNRTSRTLTLRSTSTTTTCAATVDMMCPVGTRVQHALIRHTTRNIMMRSIVTMLSNTGPQDGRSARRPCTKSHYQQILAPIRPDG